MLIAAEGPEPPESTEPTGVSLRIGELGRRAGVPAATLRAWERRYGIVEPHRTEAGYRLYTGEDQRRLEAMVELITQGLAPAEAAKQVLSDAAAASAAAPVISAGLLQDELLRCFEAYDEPGAHSVIDRASDGRDIDGLVCEVLLPALYRTGERWRFGELSVAQEHFGSHLVRGRMLALGRGWGAGEGPLILLACPPGEEHDLPLAAFGLLLRERGPRIALLGADTPLDTLLLASEQLKPKRIVLSLSDPAAAAELAAGGPIEVAAPVAIAGAEATPELAERIGAELLPDQMLDAAERLAATV